MITRSQQCKGIGGTTFQAAENRLQNTQKESGDDN